MNTRIERDHQHRIVTLADGETTTPAIRTAGLAGGAAYFPASLSGDAVSFLTSLDGNVWFEPIDDAGGPYGLIPTAGKANVLPGDLVHAVPYLKLVSDTVQVGECPIELHLEG